MQACATHLRFKQRVGPMAGGTADGSAFTSYIAAADLQQAISKYRASNCTEAYYLLTAGEPPQPPIYACSQWEQQIRTADMTLLMCNKLFYSAFKAC
jgi:hypothetical protein